MLFRLIVVSGIIAVGGALPKAADAGQSRDQQRFLTEWYDQADFYQSRDAQSLRITPEYELALGRSLNVTITPTADAAAQQYVQHLISRLIEAGPRLPYPVMVSVYEAPEVNAMTVPGLMLVSSGLLKFVESEAELAAVLSHELSHLYGHHAARRVIKQARGQSFVNALGGALTQAGVSANTTAASLAAASVGVSLWQLAFNRGEESEADRYATHVLHAAGFPPRALSAVLDRMARLHGRQSIKLLSTHPPMNDRLKELANYTAPFPARPAPSDSPLFMSAIKKQVPAAATTTAATPAATPATTPAATPTAAPPPPVPTPPASSLPPVRVPPASSLPPVKPPPFFW
jgi:predicted Zn-dependent protease